VTDEVTLKCTAQAVRSAVDKIEQAQGMLRTVGVQLTASFGNTTAGVSLYQAEIKLAELHGSLSVVDGWLAEWREEKAP
jgi:hypothetical protein